MSRNQQNFEEHGRENLNHLEQTVSINADFEDAATEGLEGDRIKELKLNKKANPIRKWAKA